MDKVDKDMTDKDKMDKDKVEFLVLSRGPFWNCVLFICHFIYTGKILRKN